MPAATTRWPTRLARCGRPSGAGASSASATASASPQLLLASTRCVRPHKCLESQLLSHSPRSALVAQHTLLSSRNTRCSGRAAHGCPLPSPQRACACSCRRAPRGWCAPPPLRRSGCPPPAPWTAGPRTPGTHSRATCLAAGQAGQGARWVLHTARARSLARPPAAAAPISAPPLLPLPTHRSSCPARGARPAPLHTAKTRPARRPR